MEKTPTPTARSHARPSRGAHSRRQKGSAHMLPKRQKETKIDPEEVSRLSERTVVIAAPPKNAESSPHRAPVPRVKCPPLALVATRAEPKEATRIPTTTFRVSRSRRKIAASTEA